MTQTPESLAPHVPPNDDKKNRTGPKEGTRVADTEDQGETIRLRITAGKRRHNCNGPGREERPHVQRPFRRMKLRKVNSPERGRWKACFASNRAIGRGRTIGSFLPDDLLKEPVEAFAEQLAGPHLDVNQFPRLYHKGRICWLIERLAQKLNVFVREDYIQQDRAQCEEGQQVGHMRRLII